MIKITPYISNNYNTPEQAQRAATCLSKIDGNKYVVRCEVVSGNSTFHFDNKEEVRSRYNNPKQAFVSEFVDFVTPLERLS